MKLDWIQMERAPDSLSESDTVFLDYLLKMSFPNSLDMSDKKTNNQPKPKTELLRIWKTLLEKSKHLQGISEIKSTNQSNNCKMYNVEITFF